MKPQKILKLFVLLATLTALSSCLELETRLVLDEDGSGTLMLEYMVNEEFLRFAQYDDIPSQLSLPLEEADFQRFENDGVRLSSYRQNSLDNGMMHIKAEFSFDGRDELQKIWGTSAYMSGNEPENPSTAGSNEVLLALPLAEGLQEVIDEEVVESWRELLSEMSIRYNFEFPSSYRAEIDGWRPSVWEAEESDDVQRLRVEIRFEELLQNRGSSNLLLR